MARGEGAALRRGRQRVPRLHRGHRGRQRRPLSPALRQGPAGAGGEADVRLLHDRDAGEVPRAASRSVTPPGLTRIQLFSGGAEAVESALPARQGRHGQVRVRRLLGRLPRQDRRRAGAAWARLQGRARARSCPGSTRRRTPTAIAARSGLTHPELRHRVRRHARDLIEGRRGRDRRDHRRADAGHGGQHHPAQGVPARDRRRSPSEDGRAVHRRRDDHGLRPHRASAGASTTTASCPTS